MQDSDDTTQQQNKQLDIDWGKLFQFGELIPLKGTFFKVAGFAENKILLEGHAPTAKGKKRLARKRG